MKSHQKSLIEALSIFTFFGFALAQPLFDILSKNAAFFVARHSKPIDIFFMTAFMCLLCPALVIALGEAIGMLGRRFRSGYYFLVVAVLALCFALPILKKFLPASGILVFAAAAVFAIIFAVFFICFVSFRLNLVFLSPAILIFPLLFIFNPNVYKILFPDQSAVAMEVTVNNPAPVIMVIFDELPITTLMNEDHNIDPIRYPNFADLAKVSYWFRNATTVSSNTMSSIPSILTGLYPAPSARIPTSALHPNQLFTLLGGAYRMKVTEIVTEMCPAKLRDGSEMPSTPIERIRSLLSDLSIMYMHILLPQQFSTRLPDITTRWKDFGKVEDDLSEPPLETKELGLAWKDLWGRLSWGTRIEQFTRFVDSIEPDDNRTLSFLHVMMPHSPWVYLPSGKRHSRSNDSGIRGAVGANDQGLNPQMWTDDSWAITQMYQRHLLQVFLADKLLGDLTNRLKAVGLYDESLIIITADHGVCFRPKTIRRDPTKKNYQDIMPIPLLIKAPHQKIGVISDRNVETIDILPTIAEILGIDLPWHIDGQSALRTDLPERKNKVLYDLNMKKEVFEPHIIAKYQTLEHMINLFGTGSDDRLFNIGTYNGLIGKRIAATDTKKHASLEVQLGHGDTYMALDLDASFIPANITGRIYANRPLGGPIHLAVAVNGEIKAVTETFTRDGETRFSALVPEESFGDGFNDVSIFLAHGSNISDLTRIKPYGVNHYQLGSLIEFGVDGNATQYSKAGWSRPAKDYTWTNGKSAFLLLKHTPATVNLHARVRAYLSPGKLDRQTIEIYVNGHMAGEWVITEKAFHTEMLRIPEHFFSEAENTLIMFKLPNATSPRELGVGEGQRVLGLAFSTLALFEE